MFKIPKWEDDVPEKNATFSKKIKGKNDSQPIDNNLVKKTKEKTDKTVTPKCTNGKSNLDIHNNNISNHKRESLKRHIIDSIESDELLVSVKKKKLNDAYKNDDQEALLFSENSEERSQESLQELKRPLLRKKEKLKRMIESNRSSIQVSGNKLRQRMLERLKAAQFRYLNEKLYTSSGTEAQHLFQSDPQAFQTYHEGYQQQVKKWPVKPLDVIVKKILKMPKTHIIADMGCGEAALSRRVPHSVRSFDLVATSPGVEACDMAHTPLPAASVEAAVYCLALMGTELTQYLVEANRVLKVGGHLLIAEVESRFDNVENFTREVEKLGFKLKNLDKSQQVFFFMQFVKVRDPPAKKAKLPQLTLKPCLYKKR